MLSFTLWSVVAALCFAVLARSVSHCASETTPGTTDDDDSSFLHLHSARKSKCGNIWGWKDFGASLGSGMVFVSAPQQNLTFTGYNDHVRGEQGLFVYPPRKFAICLIEKNACSTWNHLLHPVLHDEEGGSNSSPAGSPYPDLSVSKKSQEKFGEHGIESVFQDPTATRAVFLREPLERFASAFMNKCIKPEGQSICPIQTRVFRHAVEWALRTDMTDVDGHWLPQAFHCELDKRIHGYNVIGLMQAHTLSHDAERLLARVGLERFNIFQQRTANSTSINSTIVLQKLFTPAAAQKLIAHLHYDYDLFGFPRVPAWVAGATGEWYDKDPTAASSLQLDLTASGPSGQAWDDGDVDDLVDLAFLTGYLS